jgi:hypothetical protein
VLHCGCHRLVCCGVGSLSDCDVSDQQLHTAFSNTATTAASFKMRLNDVSTTYNSFFIACR